VALTSAKVASDIYVTQQAVELVSTDKCLATIDPGSLWAKVSEDGKETGAVVLGGGVYVVDAIVETGNGATGRSFKGSLTGFKLYLGKTDLNSSSRIASGEEIESQGHSQQGFTESAQAFLDTQIKGRRSEARNISPIPGQGFLQWEGEDGKSNVLFADGHRVGYIHGGDVYVAHGKKTVFVKDGSVIVADRRGMHVHIDKGHILEPRILQDFGLITDRASRHSFYCC